MYLVIFERRNIDTTWANNVTPYNTYNDAVH